MLYLMSTTVVPHNADGIWRMQTIGADYAVDLVTGGEWISAVGHESSAAAMSAILGVPIAMNRITVTPEPGDSFLCLRLHSRPPEGVILDTAQMESIGFSWALMTYLNLC